jgi:protein involved in polysaccharide export with SLBB domain
MAYKTVERFADVGSAALSGPRPRGWKAPRYAVVKNALMMFAVAFLCAAPTLPVTGQERPPASGVPDYTIGPQDVLAITSYDQADLSGKFTVEADGTFTYPLIERVRAGGLTLRQLEAQLRKQLVDGGFFKNPQITVAVESYKSQKVFVVGEVRLPGPYTLSGNMTLVEVLSRARQRRSDHRPRWRQGDRADAADGQRGRKGDARQHP